MKAEATNNEGVELALEALVREYLRKAEEFASPQKICLVREAAA